LPEKGRKETERGTASAAPLSVQNQTKRQIPWQNPGKIAWQMTERMRKPLAISFSKAFYFKQ
jgi:hypothetical protein